MPQKYDQASEMNVKKNLATSAGTAVKPAKANTHSKR